MDDLTYKLCRAAQVLARMHGVFFAACFLAENGVALAVAVQVLAGAEGVVSKPRATRVTVCEVDRPHRDSHGKT